MYETKRVQFQRVTTLMGRPQNPHRYWGIEIIRYGNIPRDVTGFVMLRWLLTRTLLTPTIRYGVKRWSVTGSPLRYCRSGTPSRDGPDVPSGSVRNFRSIFFRRRCRERETRVRINRDTLTVVLNDEHERPLHPTRRGPVRTRSYRFLTKWPYTLHFWTPWPVFPDSRVTVGHGEGTLRRQESWGPDTTRIVGVSRGFTKVLIGG